MSPPGRPRCAVPRVAAASHRAWDSAGAFSQPYCHRGRGDGGSHRGSATRLALSSMCSAGLLAGLCDGGSGAVPLHPAASPCDFGGDWRLPPETALPFPGSKVASDRGIKPSRRAPQGYVPALSHGCSGKRPRDEGSCSHRVIVFAEPCTELPSTYGLSSALSPLIKVRSRS